LYLTSKLKLPVKVFVFLDMLAMVLVIYGLADFIVFCYFTGEEDGPEKSRRVTGTECSTGTGGSEFTRTGDIVDITA